MFLLKSLVGHFSPQTILVRHNTKFLPKVNYKQGQIIERNIREYFYYIDFEGRLFMDNLKTKNFATALRDPQFLSFFFEKLKINDTSRYTKEFPFVMVCGRERNFVRCEDTPIVFTSFISCCGAQALTYNNIGAAAVIDFCPTHLFVNAVSGRLYHPAWEKVGNIGLVASGLTQQLANDFYFANGSTFSPTHFTWKGERLILDLDWIYKTRVFGLNSVAVTTKTCDFR